MSSPSLARASSPPLLHGRVHGGALAGRCAWLPHRVNKVIEETGVLMRRRRHAMDSATVAHADAQDTVTPDWSLYGPVRNFK